MKKVTGSDDVAFGHFSALSQLLSAFIGSKFGNKEKSTEDMEVPKSLLFLRDTPVAIAFTMFFIFVFTCLFAGPEAVKTMNAGEKNWFMFSLIQSITFAAGVYIVLQGVRMVIAEIVPAFKGISDKLVPNAKPALDCPVVFPYAPVEEALKLRDVIPSLVVKVPVTHAGLRAIKQLTALDIPTLGTAVYGAGQGFYAALAGARYIAPYVNRIDAQGGDGIALVKELQTLINLHSPQTQVLAASFRTPRQVLDCLLAGCRAITVDPAVAELFLQDPAVDDALNRFDHDWQARFGHADLG